MVEEFLEFKVLCSRCNKYFLPKDRRETRWYKLCPECKKKYLRKTYAEAYPPGSESRKKRLAYMRLYRRKGDSR